MAAKTRFSRANSLTFQPVNMCIQWVLEVTMGTYGGDPSSIPPGMGLGESGQFGIGRCLRAPVILKILNLKTSGIFRLA